MFFIFSTNSKYNETKKGIMNAVNNKGKDKNIILIAHFLNTEKNYDIIFKINKRILVNQ